METTQKEAKRILAEFKKHPKNCDCPSHSALRVFDKAFKKSSTPSAL